MFFKNEARWTNPRIKEKPYNTAYVRIIAWTIFSAMLIALVGLTLSSALM